MISCLAACVLIAVLGQVQAAELPLLWGDGVHDDTAAIQARIDSGAAMVALPMPTKEYRISKTLRMGSGQELRLPKDALVRLADGSNCPMLGNCDTEGGNRDIKITGGIWDMNNRGQRHNVAALGWMPPTQRAEWLTEAEERIQQATPWPKTHDPNFFTGVCIKLFNVSNLIVRGITVRNPVTYGIQLSRVTDFKADDITFDYMFGHPAKANMDGFHVDGGCSHGKITNLRGICFDDFVALNATDGSDSPFHGPITDIEIDGIDCDYCHSAVRMLSRSAAHPVKRISIRNVKGRFYSYGIGLTYFHHDVKKRGVMDDIVIDNVTMSRAETPADCWGFWRFGAIEVEQGLDIGKLTISRFTRDEAERPDIASIRIKDDARIDNLTIHDCAQINRTSEPMTFLRCRGKIGKLVHENTRLEGAPGMNIREDFGPIPDDPPRTDINPFVGCSSNGHTYPGAAAPFGLVQVSPDTGNCDWEHCSGYVRSDMKIYGFSHTHLSGTGCSDLADVPLLPFVGEPEEYAGVKDAYTESARTGYYSVFLTNFNVHVELTATPHVGWQRWTFPRDTPRRVYVDLQRGAMEGHRSVTNRVTDARVAFANDNASFIGRNVVNGWLPDRAVAFKVAFSEPWIKMDELPQPNGEKARRFVLTFAPSERPMIVKTAISTGDECAASDNMAEEAPGWDFDLAYGQTLRDWERIFRRIKIDADENVRTNFYTALYHLCLQPNAVADVGATRYSGFSLWDTFRAAHPLYTIICPEKVGGFVASMLQHYHKFGYLPINAHFGAESQCMIGNHAVPVLVDAFLKYRDGALEGMSEIDWTEVFAAIDDSLSRAHSGKIHEDWDVYNKYGYYPSDLITAESAARTLECGYDDWCASIMAGALGRHDRAKFYGERAKGWRKLFDPQTGFLRGRDSMGKWYEPFNPFEHGHFWLCPNPYVEGNAWQYRFLVLHDIEGLREALGGAKGLENALDKLFTVQTPQEKEPKVRDVSGLIGQYAHGNEPCHHVAYLYQYANRPDKAAARIREICDKFYRPVTEGLCGNDDCGQMSAWYIFSCLGFYPVNPCGGEYVIGAPQVAKAEITLPGGRTLEIRTKNFSRENYCVKSVRFNGKVVSGFTLKHAELMKGGVLEYEMF